MIMPKKKQWRTDFDLTPEMENRVKLILEKYQMAKTDIVKMWIIKESDLIVKLDIDNLKKMVDVNKDDK